MEQKWLFILLALAVIAGIAYWFLYAQPESRSGANAPADFVTLPSFGTQSNPVKDVPDVNPISKTNPFDGIYKNPFE